MALVEAQREIPAFRICDTNSRPLSGLGTVTGGQFDWGGRLLNGNGGAQSSAQADWKPAVECKSISRFDCETYKSSRNESWI